MKSNVVSISGFIIVVFAICYLVMKEWIFSKNPVSIGIQIGAVVLMIWSRITFESEAFMHQQKQQKESWLPMALTGFCVIRYMHLLSILA